MADLLVLLDRARVICLIEIPLCPHLFNISLFPPHMLMLESNTVCKTIAYLGKHPGKVGFENLPSLTSFFQVNKPLYALA